MSGGTKSVGGGSATGTADAFNQFLLHGLQTGTFGNNQMAPPAGGFNGTNQAMQQTNMFGGAVNGMLNGQVGDPTTYSQYFDQLKNAGNGGFQGIGNAPGFNNTNFNQLSGSNIFGNLFGGPQSNAGTGASGAAVNFNSGSYGNIADAFGSNGAGNLLNYDVNSPEFAALKQIQGNQTKNDVANLRARFGQGGGSLGTGASMAESQYLSEANPRNILALGDLGRQMQQLDLTNRGQNAQTLLAQRDQNINQRGQNMSADLGAATATAGNQTQANIASAQNNVALMAQRLQAAGMDADNAFRAAQTMNQNNFGENQARNAFDQGNYQFGVNAGLNNQNMINQFGLGQANVGLGIMGQQGQAQQNILNQLFGSLNQSNQLGTPQAQIVQTPSMFGQLMQGLGGIANAGANIYGATRGFGGGGGTSGGYNWGPSGTPQITSSMPQFLAPPTGNYSPFGSIVPTYGTPNPFTFNPQFR